MGLPWAFLSGRVISSPPCDAPALAVHHVDLLADLVISETDQQWSTKANNLQTICHPNYSKLQS